MASGCQCGRRAKINGNSEVEFPLAGALTVRLDWKCYEYQTLDSCLAESFCLYVFHHPDDGDRPFYIGKARHFGTRQASGYKATARYNSGYLHLIAGMLRSGFRLYITRLGETAFADVEKYEQELIALWNPIRKQRIKAPRLPVQTTKPWIDSSNSDRGQLSLSP